MTAIKNDFIKREVENNKLRIYVAQISWPQVHTPAVNWKRVRSLPANSSVEKINDAITTLLVLR